MLYNSDGIKQIKNERRQGRKASCLELMGENAGTLIPLKGKCQEYLGKLIKEGDHLQEVQKIPSVPLFQIDDPNKTKYRVAYEHLHLLLKILGISNVVEMFQRSGYDIQEPEIEKTLCRKCLAFTDEELQRITSIILNGELCSKWWEGHDTPSARIRILAEKRSRGDNRHDSIQCGEFTDEVKRVVKHKFNAVDMDAIPAAADYYNVSLRWLMCLDPSTTVFESRIAFEDFFDAYMLLPLERRKVIDVILDGRQNDA